MDLEAISCDCNQRYLARYERWIHLHFEADEGTTELTFFTLIATMVVCISKLRYNLGISPQMLTVLGTVLGLVISFRTSSAYDRYWEGRKLWSSIELASRQLAQIIWIHVPNERKKDPAKPSEYTEEEERLRLIIEKRTMINLIQAFSVAMKHFLRGEDGIYYQDLYPLVCFLPRYVNAPSTDPQNGGVAPGGGGNTEPSEHDELPLWWQSGAPRKVKAPKRQKTFQPEKLLPEITSDTPLRPARNPPKTTIWTLLPILIPFRWLGKALSRRVRETISSSGDDRDISGKVKKPVKVESNAPLEIVLFLSSYLSSLLKGGLLQPALATAYTNQIQALSDSMAAMERVRNTPIPFAYQVHLRMCLWIYLALLPFEIYASFGWLTIPMTTFATLLIDGLLEIGQEIENPFGYEANDLDLDGFCLGIQRSLHEITAHNGSNISDYIFANMNQPLAPTDRSSASELLGTLKGRDGLGTVRRTLVHNWHQVNSQTRQSKFD
ncbi:hypothetical protein FRC16_001978 [Serendipita sp. 398]|nr:hypothetical protein FRC16_001978 [Serendipita sp. 398]